MRVSMQGVMCNLGVWGLTRRCRRSLHDKINKFDSRSAKTIIQNQEPTPTPTTPTH